MTVMVRFALPTAGTPGDVIPEQGGEGRPPWQSMTLTVNVVGMPSVVGVPEMTPRLLKDNPGGKAPPVPSSQVPLVSTTHHV
jgi:hypothetical protein